MGIKGLTKALKICAPNSVKEMSYESLKNISKLNIYGLDVFSYLYPTQYNRINKSKGNHIRDFMEIIFRYAKVGIKLIFVFDGNTNSEAKRETMDLRIERKCKCQETIQSLIEDITKEPINTESDNLYDIGHEILAGNGGTVEQRIELEFSLKNYINVSADKVNDLMTLFKLMNVCYLIAQGEADFLLASLYKQGHIDGVISEDTDMLTHGIDILVRGGIDYELRREGKILVYTLSNILEETGLTNKQFIDFCILCGCDYCPKIKGIAHVTGLSLLRKHSNISNIVNLIEKGTIKHKPECTLEEYNDKYGRAVKIFSNEQEELSNFTLSEYEISPDFKDWVLTNTNYTLETLETNIRILKICA